MKVMCCDEKNVSEITSVLNKILMRLYVVFCKIRPRVPKITMNEQLYLRMTRGEKCVNGPIPL